MDFQHLYEVLIEKLMGWLETAIAMLPNLAMAVLVMVAFFFIARATRKAVGGVLKKAGVHATVRGVAEPFLQYLVLVGGFMIALSILQLDGAVTSVLAGAGVVGLALGFAFQDIAANFISGVGLSFRRPFERGDLIETNGEIGVATQIDLRSTELVTTDGKRVIIPNKEIYQTKLINHSTEDARRVDLEVGVSYDSDLRQVAELTEAAVSGVSTRIDDKPVQIFFEGFGGSSIDLVARFWVPFESQADIKGATHEAIIRIKESYDEHDITIPFPIRTLDFGIEGGKELGEVLEGHHRALGDAA